MSSPSLTKGAIRTLVTTEGTAANPSFQPILQAINVKAVNVPSGGPDRFRVILSDGEHFCQGMLATQLNSLVQGNEMQTDSVIQLEEFMNNKVHNRTVIIVLKIKILPVHPGHRIGSPVDVEQAVGGAAAAAPAPAAQPLYNSTNSGAAGAAASAGNSYGGSSYGNSKPASTSPNSNPYGSRPSSSGGGNRYGGGGSSQAPIVRTDPASGITPISQLNMYNNRWTLLARITAKSDIRTWSNAKGEGSLFSVEFLDSSGMDIRATFFREAVDKFYSVLEEGKVYRVSGGRLKVANMQYNTCKSNFEITFDQNAEIHLETGPASTGIKQMNYDLVRIADLENVEANKIVDVLAVVKHVAEPANLISKKNGQELTKCDLTLIDDSNAEVSLTVWGEKARAAVGTYAGNPVCVFRRARVSDFGGKSLSGSGPVDVEPDLAEARTLRQWWQSTGSTGGTQSRSLSTSVGGGGKMDRLPDRKRIASIKNENLGYQEGKPDWLSFKANITFIKKDKEGGAWYPACANAGEPCKNRYKVTQTVDGQWQCDKCQGTFDHAVRRWIFSAVVEDDTASTWVSLFNEQAETLLQATADDIYNKTAQGGGNPQDQDVYDSLFAKSAFTEWILKCKVKNEQVNDEMRVKTSVYTMHPVDYVKESNDLIAAIEKF